MIGAARSCAMIGAASRLSMVKRGVPVGVSREFNHTSLHLRTGTRAHVMEAFASRP